MTKQKQEQFKEMFDLTKNYTMEDAKELINSIAKNVACNYGIPESKAKKIVIASICGDQMGNCIEEGADLMISNWTGIDDFLC